MATPSGTHPRVQRLPLERARRFAHENQEAVAVADRVRDEVSRLTPREGLLQPALDAGQSPPGSDRQDESIVQHRAKSQASFSKMGVPAHHSSSRQSTPRTPRSAGSLISGGSILSSGQGLRGRLQGLTEAAQCAEATIAEVLSSSGTQDQGQTPAPLNSAPQEALLSVSCPADFALSTPPAPSLPSGFQGFGNAGHAGEVLHDDCFSVASDAFSTIASRFLGVLILVGAVFLLVLEAGSSAGAGGGAKMGARFASCGAAVVLMLVALALLLRLRAPTTIQLSRVNGAWSLSLQRRSLPPLVRPLADLEAFVETFGYCSRLRVRFWGRRAGHTTSRQGAVHLFFTESSAGAPLAMSASLQEPLAFFTKLRDVLAATSHELSPIVANYVADWATASVVVS